MSEGEGALEGGDPRETGARVESNPLFLSLSCSRLLAHLQGLPRACHIPTVWTPSAAQPAAAPPPTI